VPNVPTFPGVEKFPAGFFMPTTSGMPQSLLESDFFWLAQATLQKTSLFNASSTGQSK